MKALRINNLKNKINNSLIKAGYSKKKATLLLSKLSFNEKELHWLKLIPIALKYGFKSILDLHVFIRYHNYYKFSEKHLLTAKRIGFKGLKLIDGAALVKLIGVKKTKLIFSKKLSEKRLRLFTETVKEKGFSLALKEFNLRI